MATDNTVTTLIAREKFARTHGGDRSLPAITEIAYGTGGHNPTTGEVIPPESNAVTVPGQIIQKAINTHSYPDSQTLQVVGDVSDTDIGAGDDISACGLYDSEGDLVALKTFAPKTMSVDMKIETTWQELF